MNKYKPNPYLVILSFFPLVCLYILLLFVRYLIVFFVLGVFNLYDVYNMAIKSKKCHLEKIIMGLLPIEKDRKR